MILTHWSKGELGPLRSMTPVEYARGKPGAFAKPKAFWLSDEADDVSWRVWASENGWPIGTVRNDFYCDLSNVLHLKSEEDLYHFTNEYGQKSSRLHIDDQEILWPRVGTDYKGLLITPYIWECRLDLCWYYTWDCASAAIWDVSCLTRTEREG